MNPHDLIETARRLAGANPGQPTPTQADLRRTVSTAYYALFHCLAGAAADLLVGRTSRGSDATLFLPLVVGGFHDRRSTKAGSLSPATRLIAPIAREHVDHGPTTRRNPALTGRILRQGALQRWPKPLPPAPKSPYARDHRGFAPLSEHPWLPQFTVCSAAETLGGVRDSAGKAIDEHRVAAAVNHVFHFGNQASQTHGGESALEHGELHPLAILAANVGDAPQAHRAFPLRVRYVVGYENVHGSRWQHKRRVGWQVAAQVTGQQCRLNRRQRPTANWPAKQPMLDLHFLVRFPGSYQCRPALIA